MAYAIVDGNGDYLVSTSRGYGSQGGVGRVWSVEVSAALLFALRGEAEMVIIREFGDLVDRLGIKTKEV